MRGKPIDQKCFAPPRHEAAVRGGDVVHLTIVNSGSDADELVSASSQHYKLVEIHVSRIEDGIAVMEQLMSVEIPAGGMVMFRPGGMHLMLVGAKAPLTEGATVPIRLGFRSGAEMDVEAKVMPASSQGTNKRDQQGSGHGGHHTH